MHQLRDLFNQQKENRQARQELAKFLRNKASSDKDLTLMERSQLRWAASNTFVLNLLLGKIAQAAEDSGQEAIEPDQIIDFLKRFMEEIWPLLFEAIKAIIAMF